MNPFKLFCFFGLHSWTEVRSWKYWEQEGKYVLTYHKKECSVCDKVEIHV